MEPKLECPFCGEIPEIHENPDQIICGCGMDSGPCEDLQEAVDRFNIVPDGIYCSLHRDWIDGKEDCPVILDGEACDNDECELYEA